MKLKFLASVFFSLIFAFWPLTVAQADSNSLRVDVYTFSQDSLPDRQPYILCESAWTSVPNIDSDFDAQYAGVVAGCQTDFVLVHYSGFITAPRSGVITFTDWSDDGFYLSLDDVTVIDAWSLKGCSPASGQVEMIESVSQKFDAWFYEYGGGACNHLFWDAEEGQTVVPESAFSSDVVEPVTPEPPVVEPEPVPVPEPTIPVVIPIPEPTIPVVIPEPPIIPEPPVVEPVTPDPEPVTPEPVIVPDVPEIVPVTPVEPVLPPEPVVIPETPVEPVVEPVTPEPVPVLSPSGEHQALLDSLMAEAQADDIQVPENIANIPVFGASIVALTYAINFMGNVGADMSPEVRTKAKKEVVAAVVLTQISQFAGTQVSASTSKKKKKTRRTKE
jgi:hypothetical protein